MRDFFFRLILDYIFAKAFAVLMPIGTFFGNDYYYDCILFALCSISLFGLIVARHLKDIGHSWFVTHRAMMVTQTIIDLFDLCDSISRSLDGGDGVCICCIHNLYRVSYRILKNLFFF